MLLLRSEFFDKNIQEPIYGMELTDKFLSDWEACFDLDYPADSLYTALLPNLQMWEKVLLKIEQPKALEYYAFLGRIDHPNPLWLLDNWVKAHKDELIPILFTIYLELARNDTLSWKVSKRSLPFLITQYFILRFANVLRSWKHKLKKQNRLVYVDNMDKYITPGHDKDESFMLTHELKKLDPYYFYILSLYRAGYERKDLHRITHNTYVRLDTWRWLNERD